MDHNAMLAEAAKTMTIDELLEVLQMALSIPNQIQAEIVKEELKRR